MHNDHFVWVIMNEKQPNGFLGLLELLLILRTIVIKKHPFQVQKHADGEQTTLLEPGKLLKILF